MWSGIKFISFSAEGSGRCGLGLSSLVFQRRVVGDVVWD